MTFKILLSIKSILLEFWVEIPKRPEAKLFLCARSNGAATLREKQHGRKSLTSGYTEREAKLFLLVVIQLNKLISIACHLLYMCV